MDSRSLLANPEDALKDARERWEHLGIFVCLAVMSQASWIMYSSVPLVASRQFGVSEDAVTFLATIYPLLYLPGSMLARRAMKRGGLRATLRESSMVMVLGSVLKCLGAAVSDKRLGFGTTMLGQVATGLVQPHVVNSPVALGTDWFPPCERDLASTIGLLGNMLGQALGEAFGPLVVESSSLLVLCLVMLSLTLLACVWTVVRYENNHTQRQSQSSLLSEWGQLLCQKHFVVLFAAFCFGGSVFNTLLAITAQWLEPCGYGDSQAGFMTATFVLVGVPSAALAGIILDNTRAYRPVIKFLSSATLAATLFLFVAARRNDELLLYFAFAWLGAAMIAVSAAIMEAAVECTYPQSPELSTGLLFCGSNVLTIPMSYVFQELLEMQQGRCLPLTSLSPIPTVAIFTTSSIATSSILLLIYRGPYKRLEAERDDTAITTPPYS